MSELATANEDQATEEPVNGDAPPATAGSSSEIDTSNRAADNDGIDAEARKLQDLLAQEVIDLKKADSDEAFAVAERVLAAHRMRFQRRQQGRNAALDALREHGLTIQDVGWTELPHDAEKLALVDEPKSSDNEQAPPRKRVQAKPAARAGHKKGVVQVLKGSSPKVFYATGRVPKAGCFNDGTKDESRWRKATDDEVAEYTRERADKPSRQ